MATFSIMTVRITMICHYAKCIYAECCFLFTIMQSVIVLNVIMLIVVIPRVVASLYELFLKYYTIEQVTLFKSSILLMNYLQNTQT
jgi:hypothetical protein